MATRRITKKKKNRFREKLLAWYAKHGRKLPWRETADPYHVLVSEIMLQQTQVNRVIPKYQEFLKKYPDVKTLAEASEEDVKQTWKPLGYNIRPVRLQTIAREVQAEYGGQIPDTPEHLQKLKGIGKYTAAAVSCFGYNKQVPLVDTNVDRVLRRVFFGKNASKTSKEHNTIWDLAASLVPAEQAYDYNQALMDFGATVCLARKPLCLLCPMQEICVAYPLYT
ncbi:A/G-specific adenine glycosylase [candidate division KSB3 bacterium]|jgi:A/G-specific adenine glycosylase|uniref:Adenine DNA glycosylase n=1 Tax=candidate division KSB3 bacterium TaxID=2044937 RepID=A0A9D5Q5X4_9BACT|nr:A/G-specific adenine glycosylase [candidate division KSB3 bacterium]MBD3325274.1 A/G-specific adenine glycosylase [candidate division KSB3 bacterium]